MKNETSAEQNKARNIVERCTKCVELDAPLYLCPPPSELFCGSVWGLCGLFVSCPHFYVKAPIWGPLCYTCFRYDYCKFLWRGPRFASYLVLYRMFRFLCMPIYGNLSYYVLGGILWMFVCVFICLYEICVCAMARCSPRASLHMIGRGVIDEFSLFHLGTFRLIPVFGTFLSE